MYLRINHEIKNKKTRFDLRIHKSMSKWRDLAFGSELIKFKKNENEADPMDPTDRI